MSSKHMKDWTVDEVLDWIKNHESLKTKNGKELRNVLLNSIRDNECDGEILYDATEIYELKTVLELKSIHAGFLLKLIKEYKDMETQYESEGKSNGNEIRSVKDWSVDDVKMWIESLPKKLSGLKEIIIDIHRMNGKKLLKLTDDQWKKLIPNSILRRAFVKKFESIIDDPPNLDAMTLTGLNNEVKSLKNENTVLLDRISEFENKSQWEKGDIALRKGKLCTIVAIDLNDTPPSCTVRMFEDNNECGTEFTRLDKPKGSDVAKLLMKYKNKNNINNNNNASNNNIDPIATKYNSRGFKARLGKSGKYYCGNLHVKQCLYCCDGYCGPTTGCNCVACMKLDIEARKLAKGYLVNNEGFTARKGTTGKYYCGRKIGNRMGSWDGYCGPTNGDNCKSCKTLDKLGHIRYKKIL